jgi:hypothetical protein
LLLKLGPNNKPKKAQRWPQVFSGLTPSVKWALIITSKNWKQKNTSEGCYGLPHALSSIHQSGYN